LNVLDCLDHNKSVYSVFESSKRIFLIDKHVFKEEIVKDVDIFKIADIPRSTIFVSDIFRDKVINSDLVGFKLDLLWDSDID